MSAPSPGANGRVDRGDRGRATCGISMFEYRTRTAGARMIIGAGPGPELPRWADPLFGRHPPATVTCVIWRNCYVNVDTRTGVRAAGAMTVSSRSVT